MPCLHWKCVQTIDKLTWHPLNFASFCVFTLREDSCFYRSQNRGLSPPIWRKCLGPWLHLFPQQRSPFQVSAVWDPLLSHSMRQLGRSLQQIQSLRSRMCQQLPVACLIFQFLDRCEKGFWAKVIRGWLCFSAQTRQPGWRASLGSWAQLLVHAHSFHKASAAWALSPTGHVPPRGSEAALWTCWPTFYLSGCLGPRGQHRLNKEALATREPTSNHRFPFS